MSSGQQIPPWLQEQLMKLQQSQQNLQSIMAQKQQLDIDQMESEKALEELKKIADNDPVYKHAGSILIKSTKSGLIAELEEKKELSNTRAAVLVKQESRLRESIKEQETKINEMIRGPQKPSSGVSNQQSPGRNPQ
ncbi:MAG TPA: prefoldin subunit beta [Candidatus Nitrosotenuis sp.]|nr:prefoldin subunit beta [Candidatus Nitrosotenuis sp.]